MSGEEIQDPETSLVALTQLAPMYFLKCFYVFPKIFNAIQIINTYQRLTLLSNAILLVYKWQQTRQDRNRDYYKFVTLKLTRNVNIFEFSLKMQPAFVFDYNSPNQPPTPLVFRSSLIAKHIAHSIAHSKLFSCIQFSHVPQTQFGLESYFVRAHVFKVLIWWLFDDTEISCPKPPIGETKKCIFFLDCSV